VANGKIFFGGEKQLIESLGVHHLAGLAHKRDWDVRAVLVSDNDFQSFYREVESFRPDVVGFSVWTGFHLQAFAACDELLRRGYKVAIGGPHATYFTEECAKHSTWTVKGEGFWALDAILDGSLHPGVHFNGIRLKDGFPMPYRDAIYRAHPDLAKSPIKSMFCSYGCPFQCTYCGSPVINAMYGGYQNLRRPIDEIIEEANEVVRRWGVEMFYMQDDIFGFNMEWLSEFAERWPREVGVPWHCQIRLELTHPTDRLDLFRKGGCTGITLAVESGDAFLRRFVLQRGMTDELIVNGIREIQKRGFTLRLEQILAVPFSNIRTDLETLKLNWRLAPEMAWTSILAPYLGTSIGDMARRFRQYMRTNDDLKPSFFTRSVMRHVNGGYVDVEKAVRSQLRKSTDNPLRRMYARPSGGLKATIHVSEDGKFGKGDTVAGEMEFLSPSANRRYCDQTVALHSVFKWAAKVEEGHELGRKFVELQPAKRTWKRLGRLTQDHLQSLGHREELPVWTRELANQMGLDVSELPERVAQNPWFFTHFPSGGELAWDLESNGTLGIFNDGELFDKIGEETRRWSFLRSLYKIVGSTPPISSY
jgi:anaerobic magnesium-protoporphyrin IX monomethyl ester cyclase